MTNWRDFTHFIWSNVIKSRWRPDINKMVQTEREKKERNDKLSLRTIFPTFRNKMWCQIWVWVITAIINRQSGEMERKDILFCRYFILYVFMSVEMISIILAIIVFSYYYSKPYRASLKAFFQIWGKNVNLEAFSIS